MKAQELNGTHLGATLTANIDHASITDVLTGVSHEADLIMEFPLTGNRPTYSLGRQTVRLKFLTAGEVKADERAEVTIQGESATTDSPQSTSRGSN
jgi:hypothetical protein